MLSRFLIKNITSSQIKQIIENCNKASLVLSPSNKDLWTISVCLRNIEVEKIKNLGFEIQKIPG